MTPGTERARHCPTWSRAAPYGMSWFHARTGHEQAAFDQGVDPSRPKAPPPPGIGLTPVHRYVLRAGLMKRAGWGSGLGGHLDVRVGTGLVGEERLAALEGECARLLPLGAVHVQTLYDGEDSCIPMLDIEGNEFCID
ncbi:VOC family protein [Streptomyces kronopolitis]|uniref:VOC family protein n=1 Tax=Streptomyces kronopolitis TaxID=1612435 RepID=UPI00342CBC7C